MMICNKSKRMVPVQGEEKEGNWIEWDKMHSHFNQTPFHLSFILFHSIPFMNPNIGKFICPCTHRVVWAVLIYAFLIILDGVW